jgi:hypothetical protein
MASFPIAYLPLFRLPDPWQGCQAMKSKLLQKISNGVNQSREVVDRQKENIGGLPLPWRGHGSPPNPVNRAVDAQARKDFPALLTRKWVRGHL